MTDLLKSVRIGARNVPRLHGHKRLDGDAMALADSSINDRLVKARLLVDQTRFEFVDVGYSGAVNLLLQHTPYAIVDWVKIR